ncbi:MAG: L,D-transpeptidase family protein, partial [Candidatus Geothermincolia bacterium]
FQPADDDWSWFLSPETIAARITAARAKPRRFVRARTWVAENSAVRVTLYVAVIFMVVCMLGLVGYYFVQDASRWGTFPPGAKVAGVNVSGLNQADAFKKCQAELAQVEQKPIVLTLEGEQYGITPRELGLRLDYSKMVDSAYTQAWAPNIFERMFRSFTNRPAKVNGLLIIENDPALVDQFVKNVTAAVNQPPRNAYVDVTSGKPVVVKARNGYQVAEEVINAEVGQALNSKDRTVPIVAKTTPAALTDDIFKKLIVINLAEHALTLYDRETPLASFGIACGMAAWPTPIGQWQIVGKQMNPTWYNPHSSWSNTMPETIGPGYSNPLGLRAMPLNASGVLIHGTSNDGSIGTSASHGCIRMHMPDVIQLFDMVEVGTPVYIIQAAGNPGFNVTQTPSWRKITAPAPASAYTGG